MRHFRRAHGGSSWILPHTFWQSRFRFTLRGWQPFWHSVAKVAVWLLCGLPVGFSATKTDKLRKSAWTARRGPIPCLTLVRGRTLTTQHPTVATGFPIKPLRCLNDAGWSSLVAREAHNLEVVGSNPAPAIETPVSKRFRPRGFFVREPRHPAKSRDVTPVFSATYAHTATAGVSLPPTPQVEKTDSGAKPGARNSRKSHPHQRHPGSGLYGASGSLERFRMAEMDLRVMEKRDGAARDARR